MNKKSQIYVLAALLLSVVLYMLAARVNVVSQESLEDDFEGLSQNYEEESARMLNSIYLAEWGADDVTLQEKLQDEFLTFTIKFASYAKAKDPNFGLIYAFDNSNQLSIGNFLESPITVNNEEIQGCYANLKMSASFDGLDIIAQGDAVGLIGVRETCTHTFNGAQNPIGIKIGDYVYTFSLKKNQPQIIIVSIKEANEQRKVFVGGEGFIKGEKAAPAAKPALKAGVADLKNKLDINKFNIKNQ